MTTLETIKSRGKENHLTNAYNFAGPGTFYAARMKGSEFYKDLMKEAGRSIVGTEPYNKPINKLDACAKIHDKVYNNPNATAGQVKKADRDFQDCIKKVTVSDGIQQKILSKAAVVGFDAKIIAETAGVLRKGSFADGGDKQSTLGKKISSVASFGKKALGGVTRGLKRIL
jgi:hypothetical protein